MCPRAVGAHSYGKIAIERKIDGAAREMLARKPVEARSKIAKIGSPFIDAGGVVLTLGFSRTVVKLLLSALHSQRECRERHIQGGEHVDVQEVN